MGTRHLIAVQIDGKYPVAQYGQWDGYPDAQGLRVLRFLRDEMREETFKRKVRALVETDDDWMKSQFYKTSLDKVTDEEWGRFYNRNPQMSRDAGGKILGLIYCGDEGMRVKTMLSFAGDGLSCEWAYVVDLDKRTFEVFKGFNKTALDASERFADQPLADYVPIDGVPYQPVKHVHTWSLDDLPSDKAFVETLEPEEEDEEAA